MTEELPPGWVWAEFGFIADTQLGKMLSQESRQGLEPYPYLRNRNVQWHRFDYSEVARMDFSDAELRKYELRPGDLLVCEGGEVGRCAVWRKPPGEMYFQKALHRVRSVKGVEIKWVEYFLRWSAETGRFGGSTSGSTITHLPQRDLRMLQVPLAPTAEQGRIVAAIEEYFSHLDAVYGAVEAAQQKLEAFRRSSFQELFDRPDWPWTTLGQIAEVKGGVTKDSRNQGNPAYVEVPYLRVANVQRGFLDLDKITTIRVKPEKALSLELKPGDILFNEGGDRDKLGRGWVWEGQVESCIHQNHVFRARLTSEAFDPYFVSMHGNTWGQQWFETHGKQTTNLASLNLTTLKSFPVPSPSLSEQREIVGRLREVMEMEDSLRADLNQANRHTATLRRSILSNAFSGRLVPQDPNDEPASALLERIADSRR